MVLIGILVGLFFLFALVGGVYMYFYAVVRDHSGKRQENLWEKEIAPHPGYSEENRKKIIEGAKYIKSHITEVVRIKSHDGPTLVGHVVAPENTAPRGVFIMVHGYRSHAVHDFSCAVKAVNDLGYACLLIDQRAHGFSEGEKIGFGALSVASDPALSQTTPTTASTNPIQTRRCGRSPSSSHAATTTAKGNAATTIPA